jgi:hypothetical protein
VARASQRAGIELGDAEVLSSLFLLHLEPGERGSMATTRFDALCPRSGGQPLIHFWIYALQRVGESADGDITICSMRQA